MAKNPETYLCKDDNGFFVADGDEPGFDINRLWFVGARMTIKGKPYFFGGNSWFALDSDGRRATYVRDYGAKGFAAHDKRMAESAAKTSRQIYLDDPLGDWHGRNE